MKLTVQTLGDVAVVVLEVEELDAGNTPGCKGAIAPLLEANAKVVLDLSRVRFVDSSGLGFFLSCLRKLMARGGDLKLCGMSKQVRAVFELVRIHRILEIHKTREEAIRAFQRDTRTTPAREATT
jgi:anti-sigma B factor antagonist